MTEQREYVPISDIEYLLKQYYRDVRGFPEFWDCTPVSVEPRNAWWKRVYERLKK